MPQSASCATSCILSLQRVSYAYTQRGFSSLPGPATCHHLSANFNILFGLYLQSLLSTRTPYEEFHRLFKSVPMDQFPINGNNNYIQIPYQCCAYNSYILNNYWTGFLCFFFYKMIMRTTINYNCSFSCLQGF